MKNYWLDEHKSEHFFVDKAPKTITIPEIIKLDASVIPEKTEIKLPLYTWTLDLHDYGKLVEISIADGLPKLQWDQKKHEFNQFMSSGNVVVSAHNTQFLLLGDWLKDTFAGKTTGDVSIFMINTNTGQIENSWTLNKPWLKEINFYNDKIEIELTYNEAFWEKGINR